MPIGRTEGSVGTPNLGDQGVPKVQPLILFPHLAKNSKLFLLLDQEGQFFSGETATRLNLIISQLLTSKDLQTHPHSP